MENCTINEWVQKIAVMPGKTVNVTWLQQSLRDGGGGIY